MRQLRTSNTYARLVSTSGTWGEVQIISTSERIALDVMARNYDTAGHLHRDHALVNLSIEAARQLRDMLDQAIDHAASVSLDTRQTALWPYGPARLDTCGRGRAI